MSSHAIAETLIDNPYNVGANRAYKDESGNVVFSFQTAWARTHGRNELVLKGIKKKDMSNQIVDKAFMYRYLVVVFHR